jgi:hypothetical protein
LEDELPPLKRNIERLKLMLLEEKVRRTLPPGMSLAELRSIRENALSMAAEGK